MSRVVSPGVSNHGSDTEDGDGIAGNSFQILSDNVEQLSEKRAETRISALNSINKELRLNFHHDFLEDRKFTIVEALKRGLKKGSPQEQVLCATTISLVSITLGTDAEEFYQDVAAILQEKVTDTTQSEVRCAAQSALSMLAFVANSDELSTISLLGLFYKQLTTANRTEAERTSAIHAWKLLATTVSGHYLHTNCMPTQMKAFVDCLKTGDVDTRLAAGECLALLVEVARKEEEEFVVDDLATFTNVDVEEMLDMLHLMASDHTKQTAKKDKTKQKAPFKNILSFIETGDYSGETLSFKHQKFSFSTWTELIQLNAMRYHLGEGLSIHFENNDLLENIFGIELDRSMKRVSLSQTEKRIFLSPSSAFAKSKTKELKKQRTNRRNFEEQFINEE